MNKRIRKKKGLSKITAEECWSLDLTLAKYILPRLQKYKEINVYSYPNSFTNIENWHKVLDKMIRAFDLIIQCAYGNLTLEQENKANKYIEEGLNLFAKYFTNLWD